MSVEMAVWRMTPEGPRSLGFSRMETERMLEDLIVADPHLVDLDVLVVGRQVRTAAGGIIDVLAMDVDARLHVLELKRDRTPRDVVAQLLDYGSWVVDLALDDVRAIWATQGRDGSLDDAFAERFDTALPDLFNPDHRLTVVASDLDVASHRIVTYLAERFGVPINTVFFRHFDDEGRRYLARSWLLPPERLDASGPRTSGAGRVRPWNGRDFYVVLGRAPENPRWPACRAHGYVGAGGGVRYSRPLESLDVGHRVFVHVAQAGYVAVGEVTGKITPLRDLILGSDGHEVRVIDQPEVDTVIRERALDPDPAITEYAVPVRWLVTRDLEQAVWEPGLFANQATACRLRDERTLEILRERFELDGD